MPTAVSVTCECGKKLELPYRPKLGFMQCPACGKQVPIDEPAAPLGYAEPHLQPRAVKEIEPYAPIIAGAKWLAILAIFAMVAGIIDLLAAALFLISANFSVFGACAITGIGLLAAAAIMNMLGSVGLAIRDIAMNASR
jgi:hypothetical protein